MEQSAQQSKRNLFHEFIVENALYETHGLEELRSVTTGTPPSLAIDAGVILAELREHVRAVEPLWMLSGLIPTTLKDFVATYVQRFAEAKLRIVVVFNGINVHAIASLGTPATPMRFDEWKALIPSASLRTLPPATKDSFETSLAGVQFGEEVTVAMISALRGLGVEVWRAPYVSWGQMAAFMAPTNKYVGEVLGPYEMIAMRAVDRVVLDVDVANGTFTALSKNAVMEKIKAISGLSAVQPDDLIHAIIIDSTHPNIHEEWLDMGPYSFQSFPHLLLQMVTKEEPGRGIVTKMSKMPGLVKCAFLRSRALIECTPVLHVSADVLPLSKLTGNVTYGSLREVFGFPAPSLYYFFAATGLLSPAVLSTVVSMRILDHGPLAETREFQQAAEFIIPLRTQIVFQLIQLLSHVSNPNFGGSYQLLWTRTYHQRPNFGGMSVTPILRPPPIKLDEWTSLDVPPSPSDLTFHYVLRNAEKAQPMGHYSNVGEALTAIHLKALDLLGYFTHATHASNTEVSGQSIYSDALQQCAPEFSHLGVLLIELIRTRNLTDSRLTFLRKDVVDVPQAPGVNFAVRLVSMLPVALKSPWTGPVSAPLLAYNAMLSSMQQTLRALLEVIAVTLFFTDIHEEPRYAHRMPPPNTFGVEHYTDLAERLPFRTVPGTHAGVIMQHILTDDAFGKCASRDAAWANLHTTFPDCENIENDVRRMHGLWSSADRIISKLYTEDPGAFEAANRSIRSVTDLVARRFSGLGL